MNVAVIGGDGYCGWATALHLSARGMNVTIVDNLVRRKWDENLGIQSLTPITTIAKRLAALEHRGMPKIRFRNIDVGDYKAMSELLRTLRPQAIVHFGQQRSAPYSMIDRDHAIRTLINNTAGNLNLLWAIRENCPDTHLVKLGTMGEYGTPDIDIEEGFIEIRHKGRKDVLPFPKQPGSFYHLTKVHDSDQIYFVCRAWGLRATDLHQGIVYGLSTDETLKSRRLINRFDYDHIFGTVLNRFCVEAALGRPLTVYGEGGQTRTFLNIRDTVQCVEIAIRNPAAAGEYRVFNQFTEIFSVEQLAEKVARAGSKMGLDVRIEHLNNPRKEKEQHYYATRNANLLGLGLEPTLLTDATIVELIEAAQRYASRADASVIDPSIAWNGFRASKASTAS